MNQHVAQHDNKPSRNVGKMVIRLCVLILLMIGIIEYGCWSASRHLYGRWENDERYLIFSSAGEELLTIQSKDCEGWPSLQTGNATLHLAPTTGGLIFPGRLGSQSYRLVGLGRSPRWLLIDDAGPIPPGRYTYTQADTFPIIGICGLRG